MASRRRQDDSDSSDDGGVELGRRPAPQPVGRGDARRLRASREREINGGRASDSVSDTFVGRRPVRQGRSRGEAKRDEDEGLEMRPRPKRSLGDALVAEADAHEERARAERSESSSEEDGDDGADGPRRRGGEEDGEVDAALAQHAAAEDGRPAPKRRDAQLGAGDMAGILTMVVAGLTCFAFEVLCLYDGQCFVKSDGADPALDAMGVAWLPLCALSLAVVVPLFLAATDAANRLRGTAALETAADRRRERRDRLVVLGALVVALVLGLLCLALAIQRGEMIRTAHFKRGPRRAWRKCDALAHDDPRGSSGKWRDRGSCPYSNDVLVHYKRAHTLAKQRKTNQTHLFIAAIVFTISFFLTALALTVAFLGLCGQGSSGSSSFQTDMIRRKKPLIQRRRH